MELSHIEDVHLVFCWGFFVGGGVFIYLAVYKLITDNKQNIFSLKVEYSDIINYSLNKLVETILKLSLVKKKLALLLLLLLFKNCNNFNIKLNIKLKINDSIKTNINARKNQKTTYPSTTKPTLRQDDRINFELIKKSWLKRRLHYYSAGTKIRKKLREKQKIDKLLTNIPTGNITELNDLIHAGMKLDMNKIGVL